MDSGIPPGRPLYPADGGSCQTGGRMARRSVGNEERPPVGLVALPQVIFPTIYGLEEYGSYPIYPNKESTIPESAVTG